VDGLAAEGREVEGLAAEGREVEGLVAEGREVEGLVAEGREEVPAQKLAAEYTGCLKLAEAAAAEAVAQ